MEPAPKIKPVPSTATPTSPSSTAAIKPPNPYARDPSRRAIACVTCAKAKTRCDKALPSCSRCIAKGIKCDPRSTRRTTDSNYRCLRTKRPLMTSKHFSTPGVLQSSNSFPSPRNMPSMRPRSIMRAPSHIDFRTAVKMSQQAIIMSDMPKRTPLPKYGNQIVDESYSCAATPEPGLRYTPEIERDGFPFSRGATPQTPAEPIVNDDSLSLVDDIGYLDYQPWAKDGLVPVGLGFGDMDMAMPDTSWMTPKSCDISNANYFAHHFDVAATVQAQSICYPLLANSANWSAFQIPLHDETVSDEKALEHGLDSGIVMQGEWTQSIPPRQELFIDMGKLITSAPYVPKMQAIPSNAPVWEDVFMPSSIPY